MYMYLYMLEIKPRSRKYSNSEPVHSLGSEKALMEREGEFECSKKSSVGRLEKKPGDVLVASYMAQVIKDY